jgi:hypothetical protein
MHFSIDTPMNTGSAGENIFQIFFALVVKGATGGIV